MIQEHNMAGRKEPLGIVIFPDTMHAVIPCMCIVCYILPDHPFPFFYQFNTTIGTSFYCKIDFPMTILENLLHSVLKYQDNLTLPFSHLFSIQGTLLCQDCIVCSYMGCCSWGQCTHSLIYQLILFFLASSSLCNGFVLIMFLAEYHHEYLL